MAFNVKSLYKGNTGNANNTSIPKGFNVQSLRSREFELKLGEDKSIGNISYAAKLAIENNTLDSYTPQNDTEKNVLDKYKKWTGYGRTYEAVKAQYDTNKFGKGNIDLTARPIYKNGDGKISTVESIGISEDGKEIVIPTIVKDKNGKAKKLNDNEAIEHYHNTGEYLGKFNTRDEADEYAQTLHIDQDLYYSALPEMTAEEEQTLSKYGFNPITFSNDDFKVWAEAHNFEYRMAGNELTGKEYEWLPKAASKWNPWKTLTTDEEEVDKETLERFIEKKNIKTNATKHPVFTSAVTVVTAPVRGIAGTIATVEDTAKSALGKDITTTDSAHGIVEDASLIRETVTDKHASKWFGGANGKLGNYGALTYNGLMSLGDTVVTSLTLKGIGSGMGLTGKALTKFTSNTTSGLLASNSASSTIMQKKKEGLSDGKAVAVGLSTGIAEFITEKYSLETIFKTPTSVLRQGVRGFIAEGFEEMASDMLSKTAEYFIAGDDSTIKKSINAYINSGMSKKDAIKQTTVDSIYETLSAGLVGGLSGVALSSAYHGFGKSEIKKLGADYRDVAANIVQSGLDSPENTTSYKYAKKLSEKGIDKISDYELGLLHTYNVEQIDYEQQQEEKALRKVQNTKTAADNVQAEQRVNTIPFNVMADTLVESVFVGDVFRDTKTGNTITVVERDAQNTTVEIDTGTKNETRVFKNRQIDTFAKSEQAEKIEVKSGNKVEATTDEAVVENAKVATVEDVLINNEEATSVKEAQTYNIVVSNLKRKAEELGLLDNNFFTKLQNVSLYNPTASDKALISSEFHRVFSGNTDPLVASWLDGIKVDTTPVTGINEQNMSVSVEDAENGIKSDKNVTETPRNVTEPTESVIKKVDSVTEKLKNEKITVGMGDDARAELLNKKSVNVVSFDTEKTKALDDIDFDALQNSYPSYARPIIKKIARDFGILNEPFFNSDIELEFSYSGDSIQESINKQHSRYGDFVKMLSVFSDVIENAVGIETHKDKYTGTRREDTNLKQMYVLASAFSDEKGVYPVKLEVKEFKKNTNKLYLSVVLTKKESRYLSGNLGQNQLNTAPPTSTISISDLVGIVNPSEGDFLKYFPDSMLDSEQIEGKNKALAKDAERVEKLKAPLNDEPKTTVQGEIQVSTKTVEKATPENVNNVHSSKDVVGVDSTSRWTTERAEGSKDSKVNIADIVKDIRDKFGIPVTTGKVTDREASGIYKDKPETIRTRIANNLPTISHELGHHLDKKYDLSKLESVKELRKVVSEEFLNQYPADSKNSEAVAEFVRIYLKNTNDANRLCPDFYSDLVSTLSKEDLKALNEIASSVNEYLSSDFNTRVKAAIVSNDKKGREPLSYKQKKFYMEWVDSVAPIKDVVEYVKEIDDTESLAGNKNAYVLATNSFNAATIANYISCNGMTNLSGDINIGNSFIDCIRDVKRKDLEKLDMYLVLRHSLEWIAPEQEDVTAKRVFADDTLENVEEIKKQIAEIEKEHPEIKTAAENLYEYQNNIIRNFAIPAGAMTEDTLSTLNRKYPSYVPFYRDMGKKSGFAKGTFANQSSPIKRAKGSGLAIISPLESIIRNTEKMVKLALRNQTMQVLGDYADSVDGFGQYMEAIAPDMVPHSVDITKMKESFEDALQQVVSTSDDYFAVTDLFETLFSDSVTDYTPVANASKKIVTVLRSGRPSYYQIHDDLLYEAVAGMTPTQAKGFFGKLAAMSHAIMQPMKILMTQSNPLFSSSNLPRDYDTAFKNSKTFNPVKYAAKYVSALVDIARKTDAYKQYQAKGGGHSSELSASIKDISRTLNRVATKDMGKARRLAYSLLIHPVHTIASLNDFVETIPRFAEFKETMASSNDTEQAIYNADDITTNFKRGGTAAKEANKVIMYLNADIQGADRLIRSFTDVPKSERNSRILKYLLSAILLAAVQQFFNKEIDEEGYENLSSYKKNNFYNFALGDGKFLSIPKARENAYLNSLVERSLDYITGNEDAFYDFGGYTIDQFVMPGIPKSGFTFDSVHDILGDTVLGGFIDVMYNKDFKGTPIESGYDEYNPSNERYTESTTKLAYALGQTKYAREKGISPKQIDHLISSYTGVLGQVNKALFPVNEERRDITIGLRNKFVSDSHYSTDVLNRMYENEEKARRAFEYSGSVEDAIVYEQNAIITSYISQMNKAIKDMPEDKQRIGRGYLLKALNNWEYDDTASQKTIKRRFANDDITDDHIITSLPKSKLEWTENKTKYVYQMTPQEYDKYIQEYLNSVDKYRAKQPKKDDLTATKTEVNKIILNKYKRKYKSKATKTKNK